MAVAEERWSLLTGGSRAAAGVASSVDSSSGARRSCMTHRLLGPRDYRRVRWKNEGGWTTEIAQHPPAASLDEFAWRASIADVTHGGVFSEFPGVARTLVLLSGAGMHLERAAGPLELRLPFDAVDFDGADAPGCSLVEGPVRVFNVMLRRGTMRGKVAIVRGSDASVPPAQFRICHAAVDACECRLPEGDMVVVDEGHTLVVESTGAHDVAEDGAMGVHPVSRRSIAIVAMISPGPAPASGSAISPGTAA